MQSVTPPFYTNETKAFTGELPPHLLFRRKANCIGHGNVYSNVQSSSYIRPRTETECNGFTFPKGHLQKHDLDTLFRPVPELRAVRQFIENNPYFETNQVIVYRFFHFSRHKRVTHGVVITDTDYRQLQRFDRSDLGMARSEKSEAIVTFCTQFVTVPKPAASQH